MSGKDDRIQAEVSGGTAQGVIGAGEVRVERLVINNYAQPRPAPKHLHATSRLDRTIGRGYGDGEGGPGGWWILIEPEIHFVRDTEVAVPDLAGWKKERMASLPETPYFEIAPDWICEVLSPSTASKDREIKMPLYARYGVRYAWLVDPDAHTLETYELQGGAWTESGRFAASDRVAAPPSMQSPWTWRPYGLNATFSASVRWDGEPTPGLSGYLKH